MRVTAFFLLALKKIFLILFKRPWLIAGSIFLMSAWLWEKRTITNYQDSIKILERLSHDYSVGLLQYDILELNTSITSSLRKHDSSSVSLYDLCGAYSAELVALENLRYNGENLVNEDSLKDMNIFDTIQKKAEFLEGVRGRLSLDSLVNKTNFERINMYKKSFSDQALFREKYYSLNKRLDRNQRWQFWIYILGVILLAIDRGLKGLKDDEKDNETKKSFNKLIHTANEISNRI